MSRWSRVVYISGPYRAKTRQGVSENIVVAKFVATKLWQMGYAVICPHSNTAHFDGAVPDNAFLDGDLAIIDRLDPERDAMVMLRDWQKSSGARTERSFAKTRGIPVYLWPRVPEPVC